MSRRMDRGSPASVLLVLLVGGVALAAQAGAGELPHSTSWIGNSISGKDGYGVQVQMYEIEVDADGTVYTTSYWDESHKEQSYYRDGKWVGCLQSKGGNNASEGLAIDGDHAFYTTTDGNLIRCRKGDGREDLRTEVGQVRGMGAGNGVLALCTRDSNVVQLRKASDLSLIRTFEAGKGVAHDVVVAADGSMWIIVSDAQEIQGTVISSPADKDHPAAHAFDWKDGTWFQAADERSVGWVGVDAGTPQVVTQITYAVWRGNLKSIVGGRFQGANRPDFSDAVDLYTGRCAGWYGFRWFMPVNPERKAFRYLRYLAAEGQPPCIADVHFTKGNDRRVEHYSAEGVRLPEVITGLGDPTSVSIDSRGRLLVCDNGPRQQVLIYAISRAPRLVGTFGDEGGIRSGVPGENKPRKFRDLTGAATDAKGNLYVLQANPCDPVLRKFRPDGSLVWELQSLCFVDCASVDPESDGRFIYGAQKIYEMDFSKPPGEDWRLKAYTRDTIAYPDDWRRDMKNSGNPCHFPTTVVRTFGGRKVLYLFSGAWTPPSIFSFEDRPSLIARPAFINFAGPFHNYLGGGWWVDTKGDVWRTYEMDANLYVYRFGGLDARGFPRYDVDNPEKVAGTPALPEVNRIRYLPDRDVMVLSGNPTKDRDVHGIGRKVVVIREWSKGNREPVASIDMSWQKREHPVDTPMSLDVAGDFIFYVDQFDAGRGRVHVHRLADGAYVGYMDPDASVGGRPNCGWADMPNSLTAFRRSSGEYILVVEEDFRAKNLIYRWRPGADRAP